MNATTEIGRLFTRRKSQKRPALIPPPVASPRAGIARVLRRESQVELVLGAVDPLDAAVRPRQMTAVKRARVPPPEPEARHRRNRAAGRVVGVLPHVVRREVNNGVPV